MLGLVWIIAFAAGITSALSAALVACGTKNPADGRFAVFVTLFLVHTSLFVRPAVFHRSLEIVSPAYLTAVLAMASSLSAYAAARSGLEWQKILWKAVGAASILLFASCYFCRRAAFPGEDVMILLIRLFVSAVIIASVVPLMRRGSAVDVERIPPRSYRIAGILSLAFAALLSVPAFIGSRLRLFEGSDLIAYLLFSILLNIRFAAFHIPRLVRRLGTRSALRDESFRKFSVSPREREVYDLLAKGYAYKEIARLLGISLATVKTHVDRLYKKTECANKVELIREIDG